MVYLVWALEGREEVITCEFFMKTFVWSVWAEIRFERSHMLCDMFCFLAPQRDSKVCTKMHLLLLLRPLWKLIKLISALIRSRLSKDQGGVVTQLLVKNGDTLTFTHIFDLCDSLKEYVSTIYWKFFLFFLVPYPLRRGATRGCTIRLA